MEVYAPWCGHCKSLVPEWKKAAKALKGIVNVAAVDGTAAQATAQKLGVQGFPSIFVYGADKSKPTPYNGGRDAKAIVDAGLKAAQQLAAGRLSGKAAGGGGGGKGAGGASSSGGGKKKAGASSGGSASEPGGGKHVATLEDDSFEATVLDSEEAWMVEFYAPWCGHCKTLAPEWAEAAAQTADSGVRFGAVDATAHQALGAKFNVKGFPTIVAFPPGKKTAASGKVYNGGRDASSLAAHASSLLEGAGPVRGSVAQLTGAAVWEEHCGAKRICLVAVLPHIVDDGAAKRQARLDALADAAGAAGKRALFRFLWTEAGAQPSLERMFNTGVTPAMYAVSARTCRVPSAEARRRGCASCAVGALSAGRPAGRSCGAMRVLRESPWQLWCCASRRGGSSRLRRDNPRPPPATPSPPVSPRRPRRPAGVRRQEGLHALPRRAGRGAHQVVRCRPHLGAQRGHAALPRGRDVRRRGRGGRGRVGRQGRGGRGRRGVLAGRALRVGRWGVLKF